MWLALLLLLIPTHATGFEWNLLKVREAFFEYRHLDAHTRSHLTPRGEPVTSYYALELKTWLIWRFHFESRIHSLTTRAQFRTVGWEYRIGFRPFDWLDVGRYHHSQHALDRDFRRFPLEDGWYLRLYFKF